MNNRNIAKEHKLVNDWSFLKPIGPHMDDDEATRLRKNLEELSDKDLLALFEAGDEMQKYIKQL